MQGKVLPEPDATCAVYVGIDVCKEWLDAFVHPSGQSLRVANDGYGLKKLKKELARLCGAGVIMEATGKLHRQAWRALAAAGFCVTVVNPLRARLFAEACGKLAKTDRIDARLLALMGAALQPAATPPPAEQLEVLAELVNARTAANAEAIALANRQGQARTVFLKAELSRRFKAVRTHVSRLDAEIKRLILADPALARRFVVLCSVPGIGPTTAAALVAGLPELGLIPGKAAVMLAGLAPLACDSGERVGQRAIRGGRQAVRNALYMAALTASRHNNDLAVFARRLKNAGKPAKVVLVAVMRKLLLLANTLIAQNRLWSPNAP